MSDVYAVPQSLIMATSGGAVSIGELKGYPSIWVHILDGFDHEAVRICEKLSKSAAHVAFSGFNSEDAHDNFDDVLIASGISSVLTTWHDGSHVEVGREISDIILGIHVDAWVIFVIGDNVMEEMACMASISQALTTM